MGKPSHFTEEVMEVAEDYLVNFKERYSDEIPSAAGLAIILGKSRTSLYDWAKVHDEFREYMDRLQATQERVLLNKGLNGEFNSNITKLALGKHGYHERTETEHSGNMNFAVSDKPMTDDEWNSKYTQE